MSHVILTFAFFRPKTVAPKHAVLFPGSGSQYVGMGHFLKRYPAAVKVWDEAEVALAEFEDWRKSLKLNELDGEVGSLGRILDATEAQRRAERPLREVVFEGPQVRIHTFCLRTDWVSAYILLETTRTNSPDPPTLNQQS